MDDAELFFLLVKLLLRNRWVIFQIIPKSLPIIAQRLSLVALKSFAEVNAVLLLTNDLEHLEFLRITHRAA